MLFFFPILFNPSCFILFPVTKIEEMCTWFWKQRETTSFKKWKFNFCHNTAAVREKFVHDMEKYNLHLQFWFNQKQIKVKGNQSAYKPLDTAMLEYINQHSTRNPSSGIIFASMHFLCIRYGTGFWNFSSWLA